MDPLEQYFNYSEENINSYWRKLNLKDESSDSESNQQVTEDPQEDEDYEEDEDPQKDEDYEEDEDPQKDEDYEKDEDPQKDEDYEEGEDPQDSQKQSYKADSNNEYLKDQCSQPRHWPNSSRLKMSVISTPIYEQQTSRTGMIITDPKGREWRITSEYRWTNLHIGYSDQIEENSWCRHIALTDVLKAREQIREGARGLDSSKYFGKYVGEKLSARHSRVIEDTIEEEREEYSNYMDLFDASTECGFTTQLEYDILYDKTEKPYHVMDGLVGCSRHVEWKYDFISRWDDQGCYQKLKQVLENDGPFYGSFHYDKRLAPFLSEYNLYSFMIKDRNSAINDYGFHSMTVFGAGTCERVGVDGYYPDYYWVGQNTWGDRHPIALLSHGVLQYGAFPRI